MRFTQAAIDGVWLVEPVPHADSRGSFARTFCMDEFREHGLAANFSQHSVSHSVLKHTLRGLHFQAPPFEEEKLVSCIQGAVWDVAVDLRPQSPTYLEWMAVLLSPENQQQIYIPKGCAHGFQSLKDDSVVAYLITTPFHPEGSRGVRYDDPALAITWPAPPAAMSEKDSNWPAITLSRPASAFAKNVGETAETRVSASP
jgi:dTDP-4-dehydrorhamnose 3,5-epimerase